VTLDASNLVWLKGLTTRSGTRSLSETLDRLITAAREAGTAAAGGARSTVGTIDIPPGDAALEEADDVVRELFARSLSGPMPALEARASRTTRRRRRG
jgi:hypothetical protein